MKRVLTSCALALTCALLAVLSLGSARAAAPVQAEPATRRPPLVVVRALGPVPRETLRLACRTLLQRYPVRCEVRARRALFDAMPSWNSAREQLDARGVLELIFRDRAEDALVEIDITPVDIYEEDKPWVFGLASLTDRVAVVSLARIDDDDARLPRRLGKLVLHEVGHAMGLHHHDDVNCVMRQDPTVAALDTAPDGPCARCHQNLERHAHALARPGQLALDRARGHLMRGEDDLARQYFVSMLWNEGFDPDVLNAFGLAFFEARRFNEAISILRYVVKQDPRHAQAHVNLGLAYQMRARPGDRALALEHLERALALQPNWDLVAEHIRALQTPRSAQGPR
jgi:predicted Zn-dependent protease